MGADGGCAFIIPAGDASMLADRMARLAADPDLLARMAAAAQARVVERFTEQTVTRVLDDAYQLSHTRGGLDARSMRALLHTGIGCWSDRTMRRPEGTP